MKTTLKEFFAYLENLAAKHSDILHTVQSPAFHAYYTGEQDEARLRSLIQRVPCILVKDYDFRFADNGADNLFKIRAVEMIVVDQLGRNATLADIHDVWEATEEIGDEMVMRIRHDKRKLVKAVANFNMNDVQGVPVDVGVAGLYGTMYTIPIASVRSNDPQPDKWSDLKTE